MYGDSEDVMFKHKQFSVTVEEVCANNANVEVIAISKALVEILAKDPVCGRSDYSDLPGVEINFRSPWRSFAEYPRRTDVRHRSNTTVTVEERHQRSYLARIRREKLTLQRVAKRERVRAQKRERIRQQHFIYKLKNETSQGGEGVQLNPGVIISSPIKGSPGKLWIDNHRRNSKYSKSDSHRIGKKCKLDSDLQKTLSDSADQLQTILDEVSTTSLHRADECLQKSVENFKYPANEVVKLTPDKTLAVFSAFIENEDNPVTSSQDSTEKSPSQLIVNSAPNNKKPSASWIVTSTTDPEIVDADSSTSRILKRKTRNVKRVNYTEMLEDDDFDQDMEQQIIRESKTSGRKIRPVKRTLERAIVDASMKKSPRKKKAALVKKNEDVCSQTASNSLTANTNTENRDLKQTTSLQNLTLIPAAQNEKSSNLKTESRANEHIPSAGSTNTQAQPLPIPVTGISQHPTLMGLNNGPHVTSAQNLHFTGKLPVGQLFLANPFENKPPTNVVLTCQPSFISFNHQLYSAPARHNIPHSIASIIPSSSAHNPAFVDFRNFNLVMQPPNIRPMSVMNPQGANSFIVSHFPPRQGNAVSQQFSVNLLPPTRVSLVRSINQPVNSAQNFLLESQIRSSAKGSDQSNSVGTLQQVVRQDAVPNKEEQLIKSAAMSDVNRRDLVLPANNLQGNMQTPSGSMISDCLKKTVSDAGNTAAQETVNSMPQNFLVWPGNKSTLTGSARHNHLSADSDIKGSTEIASFKKQSQLYVETMLSSVHKNLTEERSIVNSNNKSHTKVQECLETTSVKSKKSTDNIPSMKPQNVYIVKDRTQINKPARSQSESTSVSQSVQSAGSHISGIIGQSTATKPCHQSKQVSQDKGLGPPPPLISISDLLNLPTNADSYNNNYAASVSYQDKPLFYHNKNTAISMGHPVYPPCLTTTQTSFVTSEKSSHRPDNSREWSTVTAHNSIANQHQWIGSLGHQIQSSYLQPKQLFVSSVSDKVRFMGENLGHNQAHLSVMPTLSSLLNCSTSAERDMIYQKSRIPGPDSSRPFQIIQAPYHSRPSENSTNQQIVSPGAQQLPSQIRRKNNIISKSPGVNRLATPQKPNMKQIRTLVQQFNPQNYRHNSASKDIVSEEAQSTPQAFRETCQSGFWRLPLVTQEQASPISDRSEMGIQCKAQTPQTSSGNNCSPQLEQQRVFSETVKLSTPRDRTIPKVSQSGPQSLSVNDNKQRSHVRVQQNVVDSLSSISKNNGSVTLSYYSTNVVAQGSAGLKSAKGSILCALDLSQKAYNVTQKSLKAQTTQRAASDITSFNLQPNQVTTAITTPRVAYDYPLTKTQIKQEFLLHSQTDNNEASQAVQQKSQKSIRAEVTSSFPNHNSSATSSLARAQISNQVTDCQEPVAANISLTTKPTASITSCHVFAPKLINIKLEAHLAQGENTQTVSSLLTPTTSSISHSPSLKSTAQAAHTTVITPASSQPLMSSLSTYLKTIVDNTKNLQTGTTLHVDQTRYIGADNQNNMQTDQPTRIKATGPALVNIKQEIYSCSTLVTLPNSLGPHPQSSDLNSTQSLSTNTLVTSTASNNSASGPDTKPCFPTSVLTVTSAIHSTELSQPQPDKSSINICHHTLITDREILTEAHVVSGPIMLAESCPSLSQPVIPPTTSFITQCQTAKTHACPETMTSGSVYTQQSLQPANIKAKAENASLTDKTLPATSLDRITNSILAPSYSLEVTRMKPLCPFNATLASDKSTPTQECASILNLTQDGQLNKDNSNESSTTNTSSQHPLQACSTPNKHAVGFSAKTYSVTNDPLFAWCTDSTQALESFSLDDITGSVSHYGWQDAFTPSSKTACVGNSYTVTVSVPCTDASQMLPYSYASSLDTSLVKVELNAQTVTLNQREVIDLCVSDNEEDDPVDINYFSTSSTATNDPCFKDAPGTACSVYVDMNSDHDVNSFDTSSVSASSGNPKSVVKIIKSPLTGPDVATSGEQMHFIQNRLARISSDLSSITTVNERISSSANSVVSSVALNKKTPKIETDKFTHDSAKTSGSGQTVLGHDQTLPSFAEPPNWLNKQKQSLVAVERAAENASSTKQEMQIAVIKQETIEPICIDDDDDDGDVVFIASTAGPHKSHVSSNNTVPSSDILSPSHQGQQSPSGSRSSVTPTSQCVGRVLVSVGNWSDAQVAEWLKHHKLDKICPK